VTTDFALIGHQDSWRSASAVLGALRGPERPPIPDDEIMEILPWIPPRAVCRVEARSTTGAKAHGLYIDSFIPPDHLGAEHLRDNLRRVRDAASSAIRSKARIVSLGGFSSILIEGEVDRLPASGETVFTTGNSLTVAFIVDGVRAMCAAEGRDLAKSTVMIVGATGDVGSGCARCLAPSARRVIIAARNPERLLTLRHELVEAGHNVELADRVPEWRADIVICAASLATSSLQLSGICPDAIVCDAGYPKNLSPDTDAPATRVFFGGLGVVSGGMTLEPDLEGVLNRHPFPFVVHGCLLEGMALALEQRFEPFSRGRGRITLTRVDEIRSIAERHGITLAPLYNAGGPIMTGVATERAA
jgi:fatty aldehyde-generating acyl-ACP reductase